MVSAENNEPIDSATAIRTHRRQRRHSRKSEINPNQPDVLEGSITIDINDKNNATSRKAPVTTFSWRLRRCPPPLMITDVKFYHLNYPSPNDWEGVDNRLNHYTIDGNDVKIVATIVNLSGAKKSATVNFKDLTGNKDLPEASVPASLSRTKKTGRIYLGYFRLRLERKLAGKLRGQQPQYRGARPRRPEKASRYSFIRSRSC
jgi:hypothetical protein